MSERVFIDIIKEACVFHRIDLELKSGGWLMELQKNGTSRYVLGTNFGINTQVSAAIAKDKVATSVLLNEASVSHIPHYLLKSKNESHINATLLAAMIEHSPVVIKPLEGSQGRYVSRAESVDDATELVANSGILAWAVSPMFEIEYEIRIVVVDGQVLLAHKKIKPVIVRGVKSFNLSSGASVERMDVQDLPHPITRMAIESVAVLGLRTAAVDVAVGINAEARIIEVNAAYSLTYYASTSTAAYNETAVFYRDMVGDLFR